MAEKEERFSIKKVWKYIAIFFTGLASALLFLFLKDNKKVTKIIKADNKDLAKAKKNDNETHKLPKAEKLDKTLDNILDDMD